MKSWILLVVGVVMVLMGGVWGLQGVGVLPGSAMSGELLWAIVGPIVALVGIGLIVWGIRSRRPKV